MAIFRFLGNVIWLVFGGLALSAIWFVLGLIFCITIIGIPVGKQFLKFSLLTLSPFGKRVDVNFGRHPFINIIWMILCGWEMALVTIVGGTALCITIIGIPFGIQMYKLALAYLMPFGAEIRV